MRCLPVAVGLLFHLTVAVASAQAQDYDIPTLRGSDGYVPAPDSVCCGRWGGFYFGGQLGTGFSSVDFRRFHAGTRRAHAARDCTRK